MKTKLKLHLLLLALLSLSGFAHAQGTAIGYQGRLNDSGLPATGLYDFTFAVFDAEAGGAIQSPTLDRNAVPVTNGLFSVELDFGGVTFNGASRWLEITVRKSGVGAPKVLAPRTHLLPTPYSIYAGMAGSVMDSSIDVDQFSTAGGGPTPGQFLSYDGANLSWSDPDVLAGNIWTRIGTVAHYNAGNVGIGTSTPAHRLSIAGGPSWTANGWLGAVELPNGSALGWQTNAAGQRFGMGHANTGFYLFRTESDPGTTDRPALYDLVVNDVGNVGIGTVTPFAGNRLHVAGTTLLQPGGSGGGFISFGTPSAETGMTINGNGTTRADLRFDGTTFKLLAGTGLGPPSVANGVTINATSGNVGIGGSLTPVSKLEVVGQDALGLIGYQPFLSFYDSRDNIYAKARIQSADGNLFFKPDGGHVTAEATDLWLGHPARRGSPGRALVDLGSELHLNFASDWARTVIGGNNVSVCTLTIRGGCDLAEPFPMKEEQIDKGSVVVIDRESPGRLRLSTHAYDKRVAGIVSGANGISPGIALTQEGVLDQGQNVALTGRVYVKADASFGEIEPGDLLTTSDSPGHAMKVTEHGQAQGAILGKAMSALKEGQGMVLVLVTLQ